MKLLHNRNASLLLQPHAEAQAPAGGFWAFYVEQWRKGELAVCTL